MPASSLLHISRFFLYQKELNAILWEMRMAGLNISDSNQQKRSLKACQISVKTERSVVDLDSIGLKFLNQCDPDPEQVPTSCTQTIYS
jgi:hypothetical protein